MNAYELKKDFPIFNRSMNGKPLVYLDSAATSQKPQCVLDAMNEYYTTMNANIHRGIHTLSEEATAAYENVRSRVVTFFGARDSREIIFTKSATESINLIARGWGDRHIMEGDEIIVTALEHHANLVPWQELAKRKEAHLKCIPITPEYQLDHDVFLELLHSRTRLVCITALSNVTGTIPSLKKYIEEAHKYGALVLVDASQAAAHMPLDVVDLDCDFLVCSSHKMYGPTGVGILYAKHALLEKTDPLIVGGDMVSTVGQYSAQYREVPWRFEGGTPNIAGVIGLGSAIDYLSHIGMDAVQCHSKHILAYAKEVFGRYDAVKMFTSSSENADALLSFSVRGVHPHDVASILNDDGIAVRSGLHCAEPLHVYLGVDATVRLSFGVYTTKEDIDAAEQSLKKVLAIFS